MDSGTGLLELHPGNRRKIAMSGTIPTDFMLNNPGLFPAAQSPEGQKRYHKGQVQEIVIARNEA